MSVWGLWGAFPALQVAELPWRVRRSQNIRSWRGLAGWRTGREAPASKAGMEEALLGWLLVDLRVHNLLALGDPTGIVIPVAFAPFSRSFPAPCLVFSPSCCSFGTLLPGRSHPLSVLGTKQALTVTQSVRNPSRHPAAKAVYLGAAAVVVPPFSPSPSSQTPSNPPSSALHP